MRLAGEIGRGFHGTHALAAPMFARQQRQRTQELFVTHLILLGEMVQLIPGTVLRCASQRAHDAQLRERRVPELRAEPLGVDCEIFDKTTAPAI